MMTATVLVTAAALALVGCSTVARLLGRLELDATERLALSMALFPAVMGLAVFTGFLVGLPGTPLPLCAFLALLVLCWRVGRTGGRRPDWCDARASLTSAGMAVTLFGLAALAMTLLAPVSGGAARIGDWLANWFVLLYYLDQPMPDTRVFESRVGDFVLLGRTPLYNLETGLLIPSVEYAFWAFPLTSVAVGLAIAPTVVLWARNIGGTSAARVAAPLCALSPFLLQNSAYPWSKILSATFALLCLHFLRTTVLARSSSRRSTALVIAVTCGGLGYLAHQTAGFYVLAAGLWLVWRRPQALSQIRRVAWGAAAITGFLVIAPWHVWAAATFGVRSVVESSPAWPGADQQFSIGGRLLKAAVSTVGTLLPIPLATSLWSGALPELDVLLRVQTRLLTGALGLCGCALLARAARRALHRTQTANWFLRFSRRPPLLPLVVLVGFICQVVLQPNWTINGEAGDSMTPIVVLGLAYISREIAGLSQGGRRLVVFILLLEFAFFNAVYGLWAFGPAWTRDPNAILAARYGLTQIRFVWPPAVPLGALMLALSACAAAVILWKGVVPAVLRRESARQAVV